MQSRDDGTITHTKDTASVLPAGSAGNAVLGKQRIRPQRSSGKKYSTVRGKYLQGSQN